MTPSTVATLAVNRGAKSDRGDISSNSPEGRTVSEWDETTDVLVAGSGAGGVTGAYTAAREGLDVILVEATEKFVRAKNTKDAPDVPTFP